MNAADVRDQTMSDEALAIVMNVSDSALAVGTGVSDKALAWTVKRLGLWQIRLARVLCSGEYRVPVFDAEGITAISRWS
ncbi:MAG: hypothetical protein AAF958_15935, partial [Planctomycetota bacterium]